MGQRGQNGPGKVSVDSWFSYFMAHFLRFTLTKTGSLCFAVF